MKIPNEMVAVAAALEVLSQERRTSEEVGFVKAVTGSEKTVEQMYFDAKTMAWRVPYNIQWFGPDTSPGARWRFSSPHAGIHPFHNNDWYSRSVIARCTQDINRVKQAALAVGDTLPHTPGLTWSHSRQEQQHGLESVINTVRDEKAFEESLARLRALGEAHYADKEISVYFDHNLKIIDASKYFWQSMGKMAYVTHLIAGDKVRKRLQQAASAGIKQEAKDSYFMTIYDIIQNTGCNEHGFKIQLCAQTVGNEFSHGLAIFKYRSVSHIYKMAEWLRQKTIDLGPRIKPAVIDRGTMETQFGRLMGTGLERNYDALKEAYGNHQNLAKQLPKKSSELPVLEERMNAIGKKLASYDQNNYANLVLGGKPMTSEAREYMLSCAAFLRANKVNGATFVYSPSYVFDGKLYRPERELITQPAAKPALQPAYA